MPWPSAFDVTARVHDLGHACTRDGQAHMAGGTNLDVALMIDANGQTPSTAAEARRRALPMCASEDQP